MGLGLRWDVAPYWKQHLLSDIDVLLELANGIDQNATTDEPATVADVVEEPPNTSILRKIPAHKIVLSSSPYFKAQVCQTLVCYILHFRDRIWSATLPKFAAAAKEQWQLAKSTDFEWNGTLSTIGYQLPEAA